MPPVKNHLQQALFGICHTWSYIRFWVLYVIRTWENIQTGTLRLDEKGLQRWWWQTRELGRDSQALNLTSSLSSSFSFFLPTFFSSVSLSSHTLSLPLFPLWLHFPFHQPFYTIFFYGDKMYITYNLLNEPFQVANSTALIIFTLLYNHHPYLVPKLSSPQTESTQFYLSAPSLGTEGPLLAALL